MTEFYYHEPSDHLIYRVSSLFLVLFMLSRCSASWGMTLLLLLPPTIIGLFVVGGDRVITK
jgi:hypothetical protein